jgi:type IV pilus assembly protein PilF
LHLSAEVSFFTSVKENPNLQARTQARTNLASAYFQAGMTAFALEEVDQALNLMPHNVAALLLKAQLFQQQNKSELAQKYYLMAFDSNPEDPHLNLQWGVFDCQNKQFDSAFEKLKRAFALTSGIEQVRVSWIWGQCLRRNHQFEAANLRMTNAFAQLPSLISEALELAELKIHLGKLSEAEKILENLNDSSSVSAQSVWLALQLAERQNQAVKKNHWGKMLGLHFSNSVQWRTYQEGVAND